MGKGSILQINNHVQVFIVIINNLLGYTKNM